MGFTMVDWIIFVVVWSLPLLMLYFKHKQDKRNERWLKEDYLAQMKYQQEKLIKK